MKIDEIYKKFGVAPNLAEHMARVYGVVAFVEKHWTGPDNFDRALAKKMALIHDLGNIVKFDFVNHPEFLGCEQSNIDYWKDKQKEMAEKYGTDDNEATTKMLTEIGLDPKVVEEIYNKRFVMSVKTEKSDNWVLKIVYYGDLRALPLGIGSLEDRLADITKRYNPVYTSRSDFKDLVEACRKIEKQIQENINVPVADITDFSVGEEIKTLDLQVIEI